MKRGVMFSLISIVISGLIILIFWASNAPRLDQQSSAVEARVTVMNYYVETLDSYVRDITRILIRNALTNMTMRIPSKLNEAPYSRATITGNLSDCLINGASTFESAIAKSCYGASQQSLNTLLTNFSKLGTDELGINTTFRIGDDFTVVDWAPFEIAVSFTINYTVQDPNFALWNRSHQYNIIVSVEGLPDPLFEHYADQPDRMLPAYIHRLIVPHRKARDLFNKTDVEDAIATQTYYEHRGVGPTYLERLQGNLTGSLDNANISGIETLIDPTQTSLDPTLYRNTSFVAHQVFNDENNYECGDETVGINSFTPSQFHIDINHLARLGFNGSTTVLDYSCT